MAYDDGEYLGVPGRAATPGGHYWWAYAAYFAVAAAWSVWPALVAFLIAASTMRAMYYFSRRADLLETGQTLLILGNLIGIALAAWLAYEHGELMWFLLLIPGAIVADLVPAGVFYVLVGLVSGLNQD